MLFGEYRHQLDEKGRIRIPAKFKDEIGPDPFITRGTNNCLFVFSRKEAEKVFFDKFKDNDFSDSTASKPLRLMTSSAIMGEEDKQGRISLPQHLLKHAELDKNIVTIGAYNRLEIWSEENWNEYSNLADNEYDSCLATISKKNP